VAGDLERELDLLMAQRGIVVPRERKAGAVAGYAELKRLAELVRQPRDAESEPASVFTLGAFLRAD
jgi:hypothetical protein